MLARRPGPVLVGVAVAVGLAWAWALRPPRDGEVVLGLDAGPAEGGRIPITIAIDAPPGVDLVHARLDLLGAPYPDVVLDPATARRLAASVPILHSGPQELASIAVRTVAADGVESSLPADPIRLRRTIAPRFEAIDVLPLPGRLTGLAGAHPSARPGDGGEFHDIRPFAPGDRLRRIDWKATARLATGRGELLVRRTNSTADATILIVLDSRDDVGERVADWGRGSATGKGLSSLDVARSAASAVAVGYLRAGDRVGFHDLARPHRVVAPMAGSRHRERILRAVEQSVPAGRATTPRRPPLVPSGTMIWLFSTFLDDHAARLALLWRASGHRVLLVDTMPAPVLAGLTRPQRVAHRIVLMERADRMREAEAAGAEPLDWNAGGAAGRRAALTALARARSPR